MNKESDTKRFVRFSFPPNAEPKLCPCDDRIAVDLYLDQYQYDQFMDTLANTAPNRVMHKQEEEG